MYVTCLISMCPQNKLLKYNEKYCLFLPVGTETGASCLVQQQTMWCRFGTFYPVNVIEHTGSHHLFSKYSSIPEAGMLLIREFPVGIPLSPFICRLLKDATRHLYPSSYTGCCFNQHRGAQWLILLFRD